VTDLAYRDIRPILAKVADLGRDLVLVGGQAVNFWAHVYEGRVPTVAQDARFQGWFDDALLRGLGYWRDVV
jgi:hypothetical protein